MAKQFKELTPAQQAELAALAWDLNHASPDARKHLALAVKAAAGKGPEWQKAFQPHLDALKDSLPAEEPAPKPDDKPLTRKEVRALLDEDEGKRRADADKAARDAARQELLDSGRFTAESIKGLDTFIEQNGLGSLSIDHAAVLYAHDNPPAVRPTIGAGDKIWTLPKDKNLLTNPRRAGLEAAYKVVDEMQRRRA